MIKFIFCTVKLKINVKELHFCGVTQIFIRLAAFTYDVYHVTRSKEFYNTALLIQTCRNRKNCYFD